MTDDDVQIAVVHVWSKMGECYKELREFKSALDCFKAGECVVLSLRVVVYTFESSQWSRTIPTISTPKCNLPERTKRWGTEEKLGSSSTMVRESRTVY